MLLKRKRLSCKMPYFSPNMAVYRSETYKFGRDKFYIFTYLSNCPRSHTHVALEWLMALANCVYHNRLHTYICMYTQLNKNKAKLMFIN